MGKFRFVEAFRGDLNENSNYNGFRIIEVRISEVLPSFNRVANAANCVYSIRKTVVFFNLVFPPPSILSILTPI